MNSPLFSIILPTYNRPSILKLMIELVTVQSFTHWELIIVDDSISNESEWISALHDARIKYFHRGEKLGVSSARNFGAGRAAGKYLVFIDDDDRVTDNWLEDFANLIYSSQYPGVLFCGMKVIDPLTGKINTYYPGAELWRLVIPGCWAIEKRVFDELGGYDERLLFGENTELFFRIRDASPRQAMTNSVNFIYYPSIDGGSKNLQNKIDSTLIILDKHKHYFNSNKNIKRLFIQIVGVCYLRLHKFKEGRACLIQAYTLNPFNIKTLTRLLISFSPFLSNMIYK